MAADVIRSFLPDLVTAISDCVQPVSDQCLAQGLITESTYRKVLESGETSEDKARTLILAVKKSTETDSRCLEFLLDILDQQFPYVIKDKLLSDIRKRIDEKDKVTCKAVVPLDQNSQLAPTTELPREGVLQHRILLDKFEDVTRRHERARVEKKLLEDKLNVKTEKCERLKNELVFKSLENQDTHNIRSRIAASMTQIENLKERIKQLQEAIEEQGMQAKRGRTTAINETRKIFAHLHGIYQQSQLKTEEKMKQREKEHKDLLQEKELQIRKLETESKQSKATPDSANPIPTDILNSDHIEKLHDSIMKCTDESHWRDIGSHLGFSTEELDSILKKTKDSILKKTKEKIKQHIHVQRLKRHNQLEPYYVFEPESTDYDFEAEFDDDDEPHSDLSYNDYEQEHEDPYLKKMLAEWLRWHPGDERGSTKFATYSDLQLALVKAGLGEVVRSELYNYNKITENKNSCVTT